MPGLEVHARKGRLARRIPTDEPKPPRILEQPVLDPLEASRATVSAAYVERDAQGVLAPTRKRHVAARGSPSFTWFGRRDVFNTEIVADDGANTWTPTSDPIEFPKSKGHGWRAYVEATRLEITCGEAPFVCSRYDTVTGDELPVSERVGFLDRKLRVVTEKTKTRKEWVRRALDALRATYGFEYQGDNLLIARVNVLETFVEHLRNRWGSGPQQDELEQAAWIFSWNFWQMNGFTDAVPTNKMGAEVESTLGTFEEPEPEPMQPSLFDLFDDVFPDETTEETKEEEPRETVPPSAFQKTNQIFTPRNVVVQMVDLFEKENPGCFDDPSHTFADLYMKSGLYITEIIKRLYRSEGMKAAFPDDRERLDHILEHQVFGIAPTKIIYEIATHFILGFHDEVGQGCDSNFELADAAELAKEGALEAYVERVFGPKLGEA